MVKRLLVAGILFAASTAFAQTNAQIEANKGVLKISPTVQLPAPQCRPGQLWYDSTTDSVKVCKNDATTWAAIGGGGAVVLISGSTTCTGSSANAILFMNGTTVDCATTAFTWNPSTLTNTVGTTTTAGTSTQYFRATIGGASATDNFSSLTGQFPATLSAETNGINIAITGDNDAQAQNAMKLVQSGATANAAIIALNINYNQASGAAGAIGISSTTTTTVGNTTGGMFDAGLQAVTAIGVQGRGARDAATQSYGGVFDGRSGTGRVGSFSSLGVTAPTSGLSGAIVGDNGAVAVPIQLWRDNSVTVASMDDNGYFYINQAGTKALTEGAATSVLLVNIPSGSSVGFVFEYTVTASDGTDFQTREARQNIACTNKAGTESCTLGGAAESSDGSIVNVTAGTLTYTISVDITPTNGVNIQFNATSSLAQTSLSMRGMSARGAGSAAFTFVTQ